MLHSSVLVCTHNVLSYHTGSPGSFWHFLKDSILAAVWNLILISVSTLLSQPRGRPQPSNLLFNDNQRVWTYMAAEQFMYQLDFPPPQHNHLHVLSVPCCHGYRVKQHYYKACPAKLVLLFNMVDWSVLTRLQWSVTKEGNCLQTSKQGNDMYLTIYVLCMCVYVCVRVTNTIKACARPMTCLSVYLHVYIHVFLSIPLLVYCSVSVLYMWGHRFSPGWYCGSVAVK